MEAVFFGDGETGSSRADGKCGPNMSELSSGLCVAVVKH